MDVRSTIPISGTIRRFLDSFGTETVVLCLESHERGIYEVLAPLYFPRDKLEEGSALWQLPRNIGGDFGEPKVFGRQIRIIHNPQHSIMMSGTWIDLTTNNCRHGHNLLTMTTDKNSSL